MDILLLGLPATTISHKLAGFNKPILPPFLALRMPLHITVTIPASRVKNLAITADSLYLIVFIRTRFVGSKQFTLGIEFWQYWFPPLYHLPQTQNIHHWKRVLHSSFFPFQIKVPPFDLPS